MPSSSQDGDQPIMVVSHFHWDREWYRTMQAFRARLVDAVDQVLDLADADDGYRFVLDGQMVALEDYVSIRPQNRERLKAHVGAGRLAIGPWYVQPDSLLPSGESMVRNLLTGRRIGEEYGPISTAAYVPDSFGHPAQFPQLFCGFGLDGFIYWRGNGDELDRLGPRWRWVGPDGSSVRALHLTEGYFAAARPSADLGEATASLRALVEKLEDAGERPLLLMNGFDHTRPDPHVAAVADAVAEDLNRPVRRALLDDVIEMLEDGSEWPEYSGELVGGKVANLLPGVWSARMPLKIANRRCETALSHWAEPWAALGMVLGLVDERPALNLAWRALLENQAHDSICGCSVDPVHDYMISRFDDAYGLAEETTTRVLERLAGRGDDRDVPREEWSVTVFNSSAQPCTGLVTVPLDAHPALPLRVGVPDLHPLVLAGLVEQGFTVEGQPCRTTISDDPRRVRWLESQRLFDVTFVAADVPAFGCRTYRLDSVDPIVDEVDDGRRIEAGNTTVEIDDEGTATIEIDGCRFTGLFGLEDQSDRGDSYDFDPIGDPMMLSHRTLSVTRRRHPGGIAELEVERTFVLPVGLNPDRTARSESMGEISVRVVLCVAPGVDGVSTKVTLENGVCDHRLRLVFPTGARVDEFTASAMFMNVERKTRPVDDEGWMQPAPRTFCHHGQVSANGLTVVAPGLPEGEVRPDGDVLLTLVRSVGWLSRNDLISRPIPAGPEMLAPGAQTLGEFDTEVFLSVDDQPERIRHAGAALRGVVAGPNPMIESTRSLLELEGKGLTMSALKPAEDGHGIVVRVLNVATKASTGRLRVGFECETASLCRLDETDPSSLELVDGDAVFEAPAHCLVTIVLHPRKA